MKLDAQVTGNIGLYYTCYRLSRMGKRNPVPLGSTLEKIMGDYWIIVNNVSKEPNAFILLPDEVKSLAHRGEKEGRVSYWLQPASYDNEQFKEAWHRIGYGHE